MEEFRVGQKVRWLNPNEMDSLHPETRARLNGYRKKYGPESFVILERDGTLKDEEGVELLYVVAGRNNIPFPEEGWEAKPHTHALSIPATFLRPAISAT